MQRLVISVLALYLSPAWGATTVYRCQKEGVTIFSDRPCDPAAAPLVIDAPLNTYTPTPTAKIASPPHQRPRRRSTVADGAVERRVQECTRIAAGLREVRSRMRAGYGVKEGERLRERQAKLQARRREQRCR